MTDFRNPYIPLYAQVERNYRLPLSLHQPSVSGFFDFHYRLNESTYNLRKIKTELNRHLKLDNTFFNLVKDRSTKINTFVKSLPGYIDTFHEPRNDSNTYVFDISYMLPLLEEQAGIYEKIIEELDLFIVIGNIGIERGGVSSEFIDNKGVFQIILKIDPEQTEYFNLDSSLTHELTHTIDFIRTKGRTQYKGKEDWKKSNLLFHIKELSRIFNSDLPKDKNDYTLLLKGLFLSPSEINARTHEAENWVKDNKRRLDKNMIYEIPSIGQIEIFYAEVMRDKLLPEIDKKEIGAIVNKFFALFKKRLVREDLYINI